MNDETRWDIDPPRDEALGHLLHEGGAAMPVSAVNWSRIRREVMRRVAGQAVGGDWWEFVAGWGRVAVAASVAAMLVSVLLLWRAGSSSLEPLAAAAVPESIAIARVATDYPVETAFASLVRTEHHDEFTTWGVR